jgi:MoxR-like ATPase
VLRHRMVLSYDALSEGVSADELLERVLTAVPETGTEHLTREPTSTVRAV